jgi:drug/metabolite transporter (DMT)-like permease
LEEQYAIALGVISLVLWAGSFVLGKALADAPGRVIRAVLPVVAMATLAGFFIFVVIARHNVHG